jgi:hypothetical protein
MSDQVSRSSRGLRQLFDLLFVKPTPDHTRAAVAQAGDYNVSLEERGLALAAKSLHFRPAGLGVHQAAVARLDTAGVVRGGM